MPSKQTKNYKLSQWEKTDKVLMEDFNADNLAIDTAIKARADAIAAEKTAREAAITSLDAKLSGELAKRGNCQMWIYTYEGDDQCGADHPVSVTFPEKPEVIILFQEAARWEQVLTYKSTNFFRINSNAGISWSGNTMSWYASTPAAQLNESKYTYKVIGFWIK